jgi:hypothetical protein
MYRSGMTAATDHDESLEERDGRLVIPACGVKINDEIVRQLRDAGQR